MVLSREVEEVLIGADVDPDDENKNHLENILFVKLSKTCKILETSGKAKRSKNSGPLLPTFAMGASKKQRLKAKKEEFSLGTRNFSKSFEKYPPKIMSLHSKIVVGPYN